MPIAPHITPLLLGLSLTSAGALVSGSEPVSPQELGGQRKTRQLPERVENDIVKGRAVCRWAAQPPVLDGKLDDTCWKKAAVIDQFASYWTKIPGRGRLRTWSGTTTPSITPPR